MTQNDLDNGRLVCLIGVAPLRPAEFVIFRIGQWTADRKNLTRAVGAVQIQAFARSSFSKPEVNSETTWTLAITCFEGGPNGCTRDRPYVQFNFLRRPGTATLTGRKPLSGNE